jgi:hypothetical protein
MLPPGRFQRNDWLGDLRGKRCLQVNTGHSAEMLPTVEPAWPTCGD